MQTEQSNKDFLRRMIEAGEKYSSKPEPEKKAPHPQADFIREMIEAGEMYDTNFVTDKTRWKDLSDKEKMATCTHQSGIGVFYKVVGGQVVKAPLFCNLCEKCYEANTLKIKEKVEGMSAKIKEDVPAGQWRKKIVDENTEAQSLKKRIKRNQDSRHFEIASNENGKSEVWSYVENEPGKSEEEMDEAYGKPADPEKEIDFEQLYKRNRETGKKVSTGKAFRKQVLKKDKEDTERVLIPQIIVKDRSREDEAETIMERTNYMKEAETGQDVTRLFLLQFKYIMKALREANIEISAVKYSYVHMTEKELLRDWNGNVRYWRMLSGNASLSLDEEENTDTLTNYLVWPKTDEVVQ